MSDPWDKDKFYFLNFYKDFLKLYFNEANEKEEPPCDKKTPYSPTITKIFGELFLRPTATLNSHTTDTKILSNSNDINSLNDFSHDLKDFGKIIYYTTINKYELIVKRTWLHYDMKELKSENLLDRLLEIEEIKIFIEIGLKEYFFSRLVSAHPAGVILFGLSITRLKNFIIIEQFKEYGGQPLTDFYLQNNDYYTINIKDSFSNFCQVVEIMSFLQKIKLAHCDLKCENLLILGKLIRIIDFDISLLAGFNGTNMLDIRKEIQGYSYGHVSPEVLKTIKDKDKNYSNPFKSDAYSLGVLGIIFSGGIKSTMDLRNLDNHKDELEIHDAHIIKLLKECKWASDGISQEELTLKMNTILQSLLSYNPEDRIEFIQLNTILKQIKIYKVEDIKKELSQCKNPFIPKKAFLKETNNQLQNKIKELQAENNQLKSENCNLKEKLKFLQNEKQFQFDKLSNLVDELSKMSKIFPQLKEMKKWKQNENEGNIGNISKNVNFQKFKIENGSEVPSDFKNIINLIYELTDILNSNKKNLKELVPMKQSNTSKAESKNLANLCDKILNESLESIFTQESNSNNLIEMKNKQKGETKKLDQNYKNNPGESIIESNLGKKTVQAFSKELTMKEIQEEISNLSQDVLLSKLSSLKIKDRFSKKKIKNYNYNYWTFIGVTYNKKDFIIILKFAADLKANILIFYGNPNFDEECGLEYKKFLEKNYSIVGIDLYGLNFSKKLKIEILSCFKSNANLKYLIMENEGFDIPYIIKILEHLNLKPNDRNSEYWKDAKDSYYKIIDERTLISTSIFITRA